MTEQQKKKLTLIDKMMKTIPAPPTGPPPSGPPEDVTSTFDGNLSEKPISYLLRAAEHYEVTGKLFIGSVACNVCIQFGLGRAVHAISPLSTGTEAIMDLFIWRDGVIRFEPGGQPESVTVQESISDILIRGEAFIENNAFLENNLINELSFLLRPPERLADGELERRLRTARVRDPQLHAEFYSNIYGTRNIKDTAEKMGLSHSQWVNISAGLLKLGLLLAPDGRNLKTPDPPPPMMQPPMPAFTPPQIILPELAPGATSLSLNIPEANNLLKPELPEIFKPVLTREISFPVPSVNEWQLETARPKPVEHATQKYSDAVKVGVPEEMLTLDPMLRNGIWLLLNKADTGILSFEALQFFLEREFARAYRFKTSLALALFCVTVTPDPDGNMPREVCRLLTEAVSNIKRDVDMFGHFGDRAFGLLLPGIEGHQACVLADRINRDLLKLKPDLVQYEPCLHFGIASAPQDATDMEGLAKAAQLAMFIAALHNELKVEANQVSNKETQQQLSQGNANMGETMQLKRPTSEQLQMIAPPSQSEGSPHSPQGFTGSPAQASQLSSPSLLQQAMQQSGQFSKPHQVEQSGQFPKPHQVEQSGQFPKPQFVQQQPPPQPPAQTPPSPAFPPQSIQPAQQPPAFPPQSIQPAQQPPAFPPQQPPHPAPQTPPTAPQSPQRLQPPLPVQPPQNPFMPQQAPPQPPQQSGQQPVQAPPQQPEQNPAPQPPQAQPQQQQQQQQQNPFLPQQPPPQPPQPPEQKPPQQPPYSPPQW
ncbi:MAG: DUF4388 domain-containing protein [Candidatus Melainabacteria bacterium]|nr:DUF4388 domain-containing protein [Candidatus Melainabacteria bacterium]